MKQLFLLLALCLSTGVTYAQIQPGSKYIGGTIGGSYSEPYQSNQTSSFNLQPAAGYFVSEKWMIGVSGDYSMKNLKNKNHFYHVAGDYTYDISHHYTKRQVIGIGSMVRYYQQVIPKLAIFGEGTLGYSITKIKQEYTMHTTNPDGSYAFESFNVSSNNNRHMYSGFAPGIAFFPKAQLGIELKANVITYTQRLGKDTAQDYLPFVFDQNIEKNFNANFSLAATSIGVGYYF